MKYNGSVGRDVVVVVAFSTKMHWLALCFTSIDIVLFTKSRGYLDIKNCSTYNRCDFLHRSFTLLVGWLCWGLTSQSTIFQSCRDGAIASWVINQYFRGVKCLAQGHNTAAVGLEPRTSRSGVRHSTTEPPRSPVLHSVPWPNGVWA